MLKRKHCAWCEKEFEYDTVVRGGHVRYCQARCYELGRARYKRERYRREQDAKLGLTLRQPGCMLDA